MDNFTITQCNSTYVIYSIFFISEKINVQSEKQCKVQKDLGSSTFEYSLNVFTEFTDFSDKNICHYSKRA